MEDIDTSLIIAAHNRPESLRFFLAAVLRQINTLSEIVVCDDGSTVDLKPVIAEFQERCPAPIIHLYQEDRGFRLARSRNNGIRHSKGDYLIFLDHDCLPVKDFIACHLRNRRDRYFLISYCVYLDEERTSPLTLRQVEDGRFENLSLPEEIRELRSKKKKDDFYTFMRRSGFGVKNRPKLKGGIFSIHRKDIERVNGFDERFIGWGQEDDDLGRRLFKAGLNGKSIGAEAYAIHLYHPPSSSKPEGLRQGINFPYFATERYPVYCEQGIVKTGGETEKVIITRFE